MTDSSEKEACGRCSMSTVVDMATEDGHRSRDPLEGERIELEEEELRRVSPHVVVLGRLKSRLDAFARRVAYGA
ncbi:hypothetical protein [Natrialba swarupiae]|uniref:Uncharacterized protein n=1 Tax=Natrialba swarupiae TaxID=2448032 RepID=A0A5D5AIA3_9EURY|nr:hypothetical protein [Natrialba swarupiae]TYT61519.1 hypothetical protein FYC77_13465 [Natrialba swarupiae]